MDVYGCLWMFMDVYGCFWMFLDVYGRYIMIYLYYSYGFGYVTNLQVRAPHVVFFHCSRSTSRSMADFPMGDGQRTIAGD